LSSDHVTVDIEVASLYLYATGLAYRTTTNNHNVSRAELEGFETPSRSTWASRRFPGICELRILNRVEYILTFALLINREPASACVDSQGLHQAFWKEHSDSGLLLLRWSMKHEIGKVRVCGSRQVSWYLQSRSSHFFYARMKANNRHDWFSTIIAPGAPLIESPSSLVRSLDWHMIRHQSIRIFWIETKAHLSIVLFRRHRRSRMKTYAQIMGISEARKGNW